MSDATHTAPQSGPGLPEIIHATAGVLALGLGATMYFREWALHAFSGLMILSAVSAVIISWRTDTWVRGHFLAMAPVVGVIGGYLGIVGAFTFAYLCLWLAFGHFVYRGIQASRGD